MINNNKVVKVYCTSKDTNERISLKEEINFCSEVDDYQENGVINIYEEVTYQEIEGFGGALTEASAYVYSLISKDLQSEVLGAYFDEINGLGYKLCRTHINSCDFSLGNYSYTDYEGDVELKHFSIDRDRKFLIPLIKDALRVSNGFKMLSSPWSPPAWMKTTDCMNKGGKLKPEYANTWASYIVKYLKEYKNEGIDIWGITIQNEPNAIQIWDSCVYTAEEERDFVTEYLGPKLRENGFGKVKIIVWDHNKERLYDRAKIYFSNEKACDYIWGLGFHWYSGDHFENLAVTSKMYPDKKLIFTEGCQEGGVKLNSWDLGERYAHDIIGNLNNNLTGFIDWNLILDEKGGPNHVGNFCDAPIIADTKENKVYYQSSYYYIGHFSKFIKPGAVRIGFSEFTDDLEVTAFINVDKKVAVVIMNKKDKDISFVLRSDGYLIKYNILPHSIITLVY